MWLIKHILIGAIWLLIGAGESGAQTPAPAAEAFRRAGVELEGGRAWQAVSLFERAIRQGYPKATAYRALAGAYLALDNRRFEARNALELSLAADPGDVDTWYRLAELNLELGGMDAENRARDALREVLRLDSGYRDAFDRWRRLYLDRDDALRVAELLADQLELEYRPEIALRRIQILAEIERHEDALRELRDFEERVGAPPGQAAALLHRRGVSETAVGRHEEGWRSYRRGIEAARQPSELEPYYLDIEPLLPADDVRDWSVWSLDERRDYLLRWWARRNPLPLDDVNERWVEQMRRIRFARATFQYRKPIPVMEGAPATANADFGLPVLESRLDGRLMDDRSSIYLRHGPPDFKAGVGVDECGFWYYEREGLPADGSFAVNLRRSAMGNDCVFAAGPTTGMGAGHFAPGGVDPEDVPRIQEAVWADLAVARSSDSYPFEIDERIPLDVAPATFAAGENLSELAVYFGVPRVALDAGSGRARYRKGLVVYDGEWNEVTRGVEEMEYVLGPGSEEGESTTFVVDLFRVWIRPGEYHLALQIDDRNGEGIGVWKGSVTVPAFGAAGPELSDLLLAGSVEEEGLARFTRFGHVVLPIPSRTLIRGQPFFLYYEIYGLQAEDEGSARFRIEYAVHAERLDRGAVRRLFQGLAGLVGVREENDAIVLSFDRVERIEEGRWPEALSFETAGLPAGDYRVDVTVIDRLADDRTVERSVELTILD